MKITARAAVRVVIIVATAFIVMLSTTGAANAAALTTSYGYTTKYKDSYRGKYYGTVHDTAADGSCVRVYGKGFNYALGWGSGNYKGQACGKGDHTGWSESPTVYSDKYAVSLCKGLPNSSRTNCTAYYIV